MCTALYGNGKGDSAKVISAGFETTEMSVAVLTKYQPGVFLRFDQGGMERQEGRTENLLKQKHSKICFLFASLSSLCHSLSLWQSIMGETYNTRLMYARTHTLGYTGKNFKLIADLIENVYDG